MFFVLKRARHEWRQLILLSAAVCLVTGFFALGPLYTRAAIQSGLQFEFAATPPQTLTFISRIPYQDTAWNLITDQLGATYAGITRISRSETAFGGFQYLYGEPTSDTMTARSQVGFRMYAFSNLHDILKLTSGRWPDRLQPPHSRERTAITEAEQIAKGVGMYSRGDVEGVITSQVAAKTHWEIGTRVAIGEHAANRVVVNIVGIVEAVDPNAAIWEMNQEALTGETLGTLLRGQSYNAAIFVPEGAYSDWVASATRTNNQDNNSYVWLINLRTTPINADTLDDFTTRLNTLESKMNADYPGLIIFDPLLRLIASYTTRLSTINGPVLLLSGTALILMLYHIVATAGLALERQSGEWASMASRGASVLQLVFMQAQGMILPGVVGFLSGPLLAALTLAILQRLNLITGSPPGGIPSASFVLSGIAAFASVIMLTLPAIPAAQRGLASFKQISARPPTRPAWSRYALDLILIVVGLVLIARLLYFVVGDLGNAMTLFFNNPRQLILTILSNVNKTGGLSDPLNLLGPALLLTGIALFWLRLFPLLMGSLSALVGRGDRLTGPLATWNVARDPGRYAQLVLLLIGTLALGTAALALGSTRDAGAWSAAQMQIGGTVRVDLDGKAAPPNIQNLPGVMGAAILTRTATTYQVGTVQTFLAGIDPADLSKLFPETADAVKPLIGASSAATDPIPVIMSARMAADEGRITRRDQQPLPIGATGQIDLPNKVTINYVIVGITPDFPTLNSDQHFVIMNRAALAAATIATPNQLWLELTTRQPDPAQISAIKALPGVLAVTPAWTRYNQLFYDPLSAAIDGVLYAGFWVSMLLSLLDFGYYLAVTAQRRSVGFAVLQALGWNLNNIAALLAAEQAALTIPALIVGVALGIVLAYVILPFLALAGGETLKLSLINLLGLPMILIVGFGILLLGAAWWLRRMTINRVLRLGEE